MTTLEMARMNAAAQFESSQRKSIAFDLSQSLQHAHSDSDVSRALDYAADRLNELERTKSTLYANVSNKK